MKNLAETWELKQTKKSNRNSKMRKYNKNKNG